MWEWVIFKCQKHPVQVAGADVLGESLRRAEGLKSLESADIRANYVMTPPAGFFWGCFFFFGRSTDPSFFFVQSDSVVKDQKCPNNNKKNDYINRWRDPFFSLSPRSNKLNLKNCWSKRILLRFTAKIGGANKWVVKWTLSLSGLTSGSPLGKGSGNRPRPMRSEPFYWELLGAIFKRKMYLSPRKPTWQWKITIKIGDTSSNGWFLLSC